MTSHFSTDRRDPESRLPFPAEIPSGLRDLYPRLVVGNKRYGLFDLDPDQQVAIACDILNKFVFRSGEERVLFSQMVAFCEPKASGA